MAFLKRSTDCPSVHFSPFLGCSFSTSTTSTYECIMYAIQNTWPNTSPKDIWCLRIRLGSICIRIHHLIYYPRLPDTTNRPAGPEGVCCSCLGLNVHRGTILVSVLAYKSAVCDQNGLCQQSIFNQLESIHHRKRTTLLYIEITTKHLIGYLLN